VRFISPLFYLLLLTLPTQLGRHFFFDFSHILGIRNDYLTPTVFLTDIIIMLIAAIWIVEKVKSQKSLARLSGQAKIKSMQLKAAPFILLLVVCYLLFSSIFIAANTWIALYKLIKILEFILLGRIISYIRPNILTAVTVVSIDIFYTSLIAIWQFIIQRSIGGVFWWFGERTFYANTPGIATFSLFGRLVLRPYATFPHPNVLGGFLAVGLPILLFFLIYKIAAFSRQQKQRGIFLYCWFVICFSAGLLAMLLSFSRAAFLVGFTGFIMVIFWKKILRDRVKRNLNLFLIIFYILVLISVAVPLFMYKIPFGEQSWRERGELINATLNMINQAPLFGVGLNNSILLLRTFVVNAYGLYIFQPVHNIYLLLMAETGLIGFCIFLIILIKILRQPFRSPPIVILAFIQLCLLGLFDHYLFTLQQGQLLFAIFASLALYRTA